MQHQHITVVYKWTANPGKLDELTSTYAKVTEAMEQNEPGAEVVHCYVSEKENALYVRDEFQDAAALGFHLQTPRKATSRICFQSLCLDPSSSLEMCLRNCRTQPNRCSLARSSDCTPQASIASYFDRQFRFQWRAISDRCLPSVLFPVVHAICAMEQGPSSVKMKSGTDSRCCTTSMTTLPRLRPVST